MHDHQSYEHLFRSLARDSCKELFAAYNVGLSEASTSDLSHLETMHCGFVGFTGQGARGALVVAATEVPLTKSQPVNGAHAAWVAELANQLLGRVKNRLVGRGLELHASTPIALSGRHLRVVSDNEQSPSVFEAAGGWVAVWIELETDSTFIFDPSRIEQAVPEGELVIF